MHDELSTRRIDVLVRPLGALLFAALAFVAPDAGAHAPPEATGILFTTSGGHERTLARTNRGLIVKEAASDGFRLLCNDAFGASLTEVAPVLATETGRLYVATYLGGLDVASADLCGFSSVPGPLSRGTNVVGLERNGRSLFAIVSRDGSDDHLLTSTDDGVSWQAPSHVEDFLFSLRVAPSDPNRLYASSLHDADGGVSSYRLIASTDGGRTFRSTPVALNDSEVSLSVLAVDPSAPERVFVRTAASDPSLPERLLRSDDGGTTLAEVHSGLGPTVVESSPDGTTIWLGTQDGLYRSKDHGATFTRLDGAGVTELACLAYHAGTLYACALSGNEYGVLASTNDGASFSFYLRFPDVTAPLACAADTTAGAACATRFEDWRIEQGLPGPGSGGVAGSGGANASSGGTANGGTANGGAANGGPLGGTPANAAGGAVFNEHAPHGGCACTAVGRRSSCTRWDALGLCLVVLVARRRRAILSVRD